MKTDITEYNFPEDLKTMSLKQMELLSYSIRDFLIEKVSKTGGHLASNLGVVELTIALHKIFDPPRDKIIWDVGHQAYVHKILTGRAKDFDRLRQLDGLSGFPKGKESPFDAFDTGHSSVSVSAAAGMAAARDLKGEDYEVIAVIGDGSLTGGMAYEGLNNIGDSKSKVIVVLNDNGMSISPNTGGISRHLVNLRTSRGYLGVKKFIKSHAGEKESLRANLASGLASVKNDVKYTLMGHGGVLFEELGFTYFGPVDGHNIAELLNAFSRAKSLDEPVLVHVITKKGKGYINAEKDPGKFHGIGPFDATTGSLRETGAPQGPSFSRVMGQAAVRLARKDPHIVAVTAAMGEATGLGDFAEKFPERFFDVGIAEQHAVTFAAGLAKEGMKPLVAIYSSFLQRAYDQILEDVCMQKLPIVFAIDRAGCVGADGETHNGMYDLAYLSTMPGMTVLTPADGGQLEEMLEYAFSLNAPVAIRYPRGSAAGEREEGGESVERVESAKCVVDNKNISLISGEGAKRSVKNLRLADCGTVDIWACGKMARYGRKIVALLKEKGIEAGLVDVTCVKPLDLSPLPERGRLRLIATVEDHSLCGGFSQMMAAAMSGKGVKVLGFGWPDDFIPQGTFEELAARYGLSPEAVAERIREELEGKA